MTTDEKTLDFEYQVNYAWENDTMPTDSEERHGLGHMTVYVDHEVRTKEDLIEIARSIGKANDYTQVGITRIVQVVEAEEGNDEHDPESV